jgi:predicted PurR-regulated permease PerM
LTKDQDLTLNQESKQSPTWGTTTKLLVGLTIVAILAGMFLYYRSIFSAIVFAVILSYLIQPVVKFLSDKTFLSWRAATALVFVFLLLFLLGGMTGAGIALAQQLSGLVRLLQDFTADLPRIAADLSDYLGRFGLLGEVIDLQDLANRLLETVQPLLRQAGSLVGSLATGAAVSIGRVFFVLFISYFMVSESNKVKEIQNISIPEYEYDLGRLSRQLRQIWDAFFRGQLIIFLLVFVVYLIILTALGVRYAVILAAMTGLAIFVPYVGAWTTAIVMAVVTILQPSNYFGLEAWQYTILVLGISFAVNFVFDNYITPKFFGNTLDIHPAAVLIAALMAASLLGLLGIFIAAPVFATVKLVGIYVIRKLLDLDPWPEPEEEWKKMQYPWVRWGEGLWEWLTKLWKKWFPR